ncbi:Uncharacterized protein HI_0077 [Coccomyxa sp. Obi]|nr:Uncharacterized protein HI_0077 [Coccomyxa sp. Obi]
MEGESLFYAALRVLYEPNAARKGVLTHQTASLWRAGKLTLQGDMFQDMPPVLSRPARDDTVQLVEPKKMKRLGKGGTLASRQALVHSLVHIESWAVDLSWDIIARFGRDPSYSLPAEFFDDFVRVAEDECRHYELLRSRLEEMGSHYGAFAAHEALWDSAMATAHSLPARLAVEHAVHEARGLDVMPSTVLKFRSNGDEQTAQLLEEVIYKEEITHCAAGVRWLTYLHDLAHSSGSTVSERQATPDWMVKARQHSSVETWFHELVRTHFRGSLKPPFNEQARAQAGFGPQWYMPLATPPKTSAKVTVLQQ